MNTNMNRNDEREAMKRRELERDIRRNRLNKAFWIQSAAAFVITFGFLGASEYFFITTGSHIPYFLGSGPSPEPVSPIGFVLFVLFTISLVASRLIAWRCPHCGSYVGKGFGTSGHHCPGCGVSLKYSPKLEKKYRELQQNNSTADENQTE